jgi:hypothetical protein
MASGISHGSRCFANFGDFSVTWHGLRLSAVRHREIWFDPAPLRRRQRDHSRQRILVPLLRQLNTPCTSDFIDSEYS